MTNAITNALVAAARNAATNAHAPYSQFNVGCAVEAADGRIATGANMENACYRLGICAEQSALAAAQQAFSLKNIVRIAVSGGLADPEAEADMVITPCGGCRQAILEAAEIAERDIEIICANRDGSKTAVYRISELLPHAFGADSLQKH